MHARSSPRPIGTAQLHPLPGVHLRPMLPGGLPGALLPLGDGTSHLGGGFALRCCQRFSLPGVATGQCPGRDNPHTSGPSAPVLSYWGRRPARLLTPTTDRDRTVSRRSEPSSRTALMGEQPNPWDRLQPQDAMSRHRGAKPPRRCELLGEISLLSPEYLLSVERWPFHSGPPDHYDRLSTLLGPSASQSGTLVPLHSTPGFQSG